MQTQEYRSPPPATPVAAGGRGLGTTLGAAALVLAVVALAMNFVIAGPAGPAGPAGADGQTGPQGPAGPGSLMFQANSSASTVIAASCTNYAAITIAVASSGTVVVTAATRWSIDHTVGTADILRVLLSDTSADCTSDQWRVFTEVESDAGTGTYFLTQVLFEPFAVTPGTHIYYVNADGGSGNDSIYGAGIVAVFYPS
jgi:hypothetical protein